MTETDTPEHDDGAQTDDHEEDPEPCRRFMPIPETGIGGREMWTCLGPCHTSKRRERRSRNWRSASDE